MRTLLMLVVMMTSALLASLTGLSSGDAYAQRTGESTSSVSVLTLTAPNYPPLARQARIMGEVVIDLAIRPDGTLESASVVSGHPMLKQAALDSAQYSRFACTNCSQLVSYRLTYSFELTDQFTHVIQEGDRIRIPGQISDAILDFSYVGIRSIKCLYVWHCGSQWGGEDFYFYRVRSAKCLYFWKCGLHRRQSAQSKPS